MTPNENWRVWLGCLSALKRDMSRGAAPHKPLLMLVVFDLIEEGKLDSGLLARDGNLAFRFSSYWTIVAERRNTRPDVRLPFYHMKSDGFWTPLITFVKPRNRHRNPTRNRLGLRLRRTGHFRGSTSFFRLKSPLRESSAPVPRHR